MNPGRTAAVIAAFASITLFTIAGAQAAEQHRHVAHHHHHHATEVAAEGGVAAPGMIGGYYQPSEWGDFDCLPSYPGCRPYAAKDWSKP